MINLRNQAQRSREAAIQDRLLISFEHATQRKLMRELNRFGRVLSSVFASTQGDSYAAIQMAAEEHERNLELILSQTTRAIMRASGVRVIETAGKSLRGYERKNSEGFLNDAIESWVSQYTAAKVTDISATSMNLARSVISDVTTAALGDGLSVPQMARQIQRNFGTISRSRSLTIARTELHGASQAGSLAGASALSIPLNKIWVTSGDERVRESHREANDQTVGMKDQFNVGGSNLNFPGDPSGSASQVINCRCVMVYEEAV